jgi:EF hand
MPPTKALFAAAITLAGLTTAPAAKAATPLVMLAQTDPGPITRRPEERQANPMLAYDIDKDGTLDLAEVKSAAAAHFDELNPDNDDSLDEKEAAPVLKGQDFRQADANGDGKISKAEYLAYVERVFLLANPDKDGTLDRKELDSEAGQALLHLLR